MIAVRKSQGSMQAQIALEANLSYLHTVALTPEDVSRALALKWSDFEDCLVAECAHKIKADYIITRNIKDFDRSVVAAITPDELFAVLEDRGFDYSEIEW